MPTDRKCEISYDFILERDEDSIFIEGCYRLSDGVWRVLIVSKKNIGEMIAKSSTWENGTEGLVIHVPKSSNLSKNSLERMLANLLDVTCFCEIQGPDSMDLR
jgi:hypothetical protein